MNLLTRLARHLWLDADDARRAIGSAALRRLETRIRDSEARHTGEICLCVEASLPLSYVWRHLRGTPIDRIVRERALTLFGKLRVWDTELNNGVLIYLQLAEHRFEIVADRALARHIDTAEWERTLTAIAPAFRARHYEDGLARAIDAVSVALERHFPASAETARQDQNELPDRPQIR